MEGTYRSRHEEERFNLAKEELESLDRITQDRLFKSDFDRLIDEI